MRRPPLWGLALFAGLLLVQPVLRPSPPGQLLVALDAFLQAQLFRLRGVRLDPGAPVVVAIDADSINLDRLFSPEERQASPLWRTMGQWPWPRALQAELAATVLERGAHRVVFNLVLAQPSRFGPADDAAFQRRLAPWRSQLVLAASSAGSSQQDLEQVQLQMPLYAGTAVGLTNLLQSPQGILMPSLAVTGFQTIWLASNLPCPKRLPGPPALRPRPRPCGESIFLGPPAPWLPYRPGSCWSSPLLSGVAAPW